MRQHPKMIDAYEMAQELDGLKEIPGERHNDQIVTFFEEVGHQWVKDDETAWCAAFVGAMLRRAGLEGTGKLNARSYLVWGQAVALDEAQPGDLVIFWRGNPNGWQGHVGFYVKQDSQRIYVLGGNQSNRVSVAPYRRERLLGVRRLPAPEKVTEAAPSFIKTIIDLIASIFGK